MNTCKNRKTKKYIKKKTQGKHNQIIKKQHND